MDQPVSHFDRVLERIRAYAASRGWKPARLAREAGLSDTVTRGMDSAGWAPSGLSVRRLEGLIPDGWRPGDPVDAEVAVAVPSASAAEEAAPPSSEAA